MLKEKSRYLKVSRTRLEKLIDNPIAFHIIWSFQLGIQPNNEDLMSKFNCDIDLIQETIQYLIKQKFLTVKDINGIKKVFLKTEIAKSIIPKKERGINEKYQFLFQYDDFKDAWDNWGVVRTKKKTAMTPRANNQHLKKLMQLSGNKVGVMINILDQSAQNGYTDVYAPKMAPSPHQSDNKHMKDKKFIDS